MRAKKLLTTTLAIACAGALCVPFVACSNGEQAKAETFVTVDINPSIQFTVDKNNKVVSVYGANEDGKVLLYGEADLTGLKIEKAVEKVTELAVEMGYLDQNNKVVETSVTSAIEGKAQELLSKINAKISATAGDFNLNVETTGTQAYSILRKLENLKAQYPNDNVIQALTPEEFKLAISASETGEIDLEAAVKLNEEELIKIVSETHSKAEEYATYAYEKAAAIAESAYDTAAGTIVDGVYSAYYAKNLITHANTSYYGILYQSYKGAERLLNATASGLVYVEKAAEYPLTEEQISAVATVLNLEGEDLAKIKNSNGEVTLNSVYAYLDKAFKNSSLSGDIAQLKAQLNETLTTVETQLSQKIAELANEYQPQIEQVKQTVGAIIEAIPDGVKNLVGGVISDVESVVNELVAILEDGKITSAEVRAAAEKVANKAEGTLNLIKQDIGEEAFNSVQEEKAKLEESLNQLKAQLEESLKTAREQAQQQLQSLKNARK
ncbi:MAG: apolipoprotein A1/A4/E family protein [Clostridia bacterium]|nr:apolipoprotein A1/A4/E family protein [Clostridia bacterium]